MTTAPVFAGMPGADPAAISLLTQDMEFSGDVSSARALADHCNIFDIHSLTPDGIAIGADSAICDPTTWEGGTASVVVSLQDVYSPTVYALRVNMNDPPLAVEGAMDVDRYASVLLDGRTICRIRLGTLEAGGGYWMPIQASLVTSIVVRESKPHTLAFQVPAGAVWILREVELVPYSYPETIRGIGYSPYRDCQFPGGVHPGSRPTEQEIREDLFLLSHTCNAIRTYGATGVNSRIPMIAMEHGLPVFVGAWIGTDDDKNREEINALIEIVNNQEVSGVIVGNEYLLRCERAAGWGAQHDSMMNQESIYLAGLIRDVATSIEDRDVIVTVAETVDQIYDRESNSVRDNFQQVLNEVDAVLVHTYPFWGNAAITGAADQAIQDYERVRNLLEEQNKGVIIGETGWPSSGKRHTDHNASDAEATLIHQRRYLTEFLALAEDRNAAFMYFDAFDELWKIEEGTVGQHWGYCYSDRSNKHSFNSVLLPAAEYVVRGRSIVESPQSAADHNVRRFVIYDEWPPNPKRNLPGSSADSTASGTSTQSDKADSPTDNTFIPSGYMGNYDAIALDACCKTDPLSGQMAARIEISLDDSPSWAGVQWLAHGEWTGPGIDISEFLNLSDQSEAWLRFWTKGARGGERVKFGFGSDRGSLTKYEDDWTTLDTVWTADSLFVSASYDLSDVIGGLFVVTNLVQNRGQSITIFLDNMCLESVRR